MQNYVSIVSYQSNGFAAWYFCFYACDVGGNFYFLPYVSAILHARYCFGFGSTWYPFVLTKDGQGRGE